MKCFKELYKSTYKELLKPINRPKTTHLRTFRRVYVISGRLVKDDSRFVSISTNKNSTIDTSSSKKNAWIQDRDARRFCNSVFFGSFPLCFEDCMTPADPGPSSTSTACVIDVVDTAKLAPRTQSRQHRNTREMSATECRLL